MTKEMIMVLDDGETYSGLNGCVTAKVLIDDDEAFSEKTWDTLVKAASEAHGEENLIVLEEYNLIAKVVKVHNRGGYY